MGAAPRRGLADLGLEPRWVGGEEGAVVRERRKLFGLDLLDGGGQRHVPEALVMTVGLAVGRAVNELGPVTRGREAAAQPVDEALAALEGVLERDRARDRTIVEEEREAQIPRAAPEVRTTRIDAVVDLFPPVTADAPDAAGLVGGQDRELHAGLGQHLQRLVVGGGLGQPHALRLAAKPMTEVGEAPPRLRDFVAAGGERQDHVVVDLCDRVAVAVAPLGREAIGVEHPRVHVGGVALEPRHQRRPDVEGDLLEVVDDVQDPIGAVDAAGRGVGRVALRRHPLVPVVIRRGGVLDLDRFQPWVLAGRLVEVPVDRNGTIGHQGSSRPRRNSRRPPRGITTMPDPSTCQRRRSVSGSRPISLPAGTMLKRSTTARLKANKARLKSMTKAKPPSARC